MTAELLLGGAPSTVEPIKEMSFVKETPLAIKQDHKLNLAQSLLFAMGLRPELLFAHIQEPRYSFTKVGPGRTSVHKKGQ